MSVHFNWPALLANQPWQATIRAHLQALLDEHVNTKRDGQADDGTRVYLLELEMGEEPPQVELLQLGMQENAEAGDDQQQLQPRNSSLSPPFSPAASSSSTSVSVAAPGTPSTPSHTRSSSSHVPRSRCPACHLVLPVSALALPGVSLKGRIAYSGSAHLTVQIRRQVNPLRSNLGGLMGGLSRLHLGCLAMDKPLDVELWLRVGGVKLDGEIDVTYTPAIKAAVPGPNASSSAVSNSAAAASRRSGASSSGFTSPARSTTTTPRPWASGSATAAAASASAPPGAVRTWNGSSPAPQPWHGASSPSPALSSSYSSDRSLTSSPSPSGHPTSASPIQRIGSAGVGLHQRHAAPAANNDGRGGGFASPYAASASSPHASSSSAHLCSCSMSASFLGASLSSSNPAEIITSPATASILLARNPLESLEITSNLDGSPAGVKLRETIEKELEAALSKIVGKRIEIKLPSGGGAAGKKAA